MSDLAYDDKQARLAWHDNLYATSHTPIDRDCATFRLQVGEYFTKTYWPLYSWFHFTEETRLPGESYDAFRERMTYESWCPVI